MTRADCLERQIQPDNLVDFFCDQRREGRQDVRVILNGLFVQLGLNHLIVENPFTGDVLTKGIVGKEDRVSGKIFHHAVRPVQHRRLDEDQFLFPERQFVPRLDYLEIPVLMIMALQGFHSVCRAVNRLVRDVPHELGQRAGMVRLRMIGDHVIDLAQVDFMLEVSHELFSKRSPYRVDERDLFVTHEIGIIGGASMSRVLFPVKFSQFPIDLTHPVDVFCNRDLHLCTSFFGSHFLSYCHGVH